ncbi:MAG: glucose-1-phosphate cytidylyltransferase [Chloroflexota bacterium]|jgi:glucose-1-phosphate cytidylyltransferase
MKVVLFCGGEGLRLREHSDGLPKPMTRIGYRPILWHVMRYYAHYGHRDFVLCLGYRADAIKDYFLHYDEAISNDFVLTNGNRVEHLRTDISDWRITFADTGARTLIGQRLLRVRRHLEGEEMFLATYGDCLTDAPLDEVIDAFRASGRVAAFLSVRAADYPFHLVEVNDRDAVTAVRDTADADLRINGGFFVLRREIFDYIGPGEELVDAPFRRLIAEGQLLAFRHDGFWAPMDTLRDVQRLEAAVEEGRPPWAVWLDGGAVPVR